LADFALDVRAWVEKAKGRADRVVQKICTDLAASLIAESPVGNPSLWAANENAVLWNDGALEVNKELRLNPENVNRAGRLKPGIKIHRRSLPVGKGYVGGRFKGNWRVGINGIPIGETGSIDRNGSETKEIATAAILTSKAGDVIFIVNNVPYAHRLEYGWSKQAPLGMVRITLVRFQAIVDKAVAESKIEIP
jgi:hypothetical protein